MAGGTITDGIDVMGKNRRRPTDRTAVTAITLGRGADMGRWFYLRILRQESARVAGGTIPGSERSGAAGMVHDARGPGRKATGVTGIALSRGRNMNIRLSLSIGKIEGAVMAARTLTCRGSMVHLCRFKGSNISVTGITLPGRWHMINRFTDSCNIVMTVRTAVNH